MISIQDVEKLANLSRLALTEAEKASFSNEIGAILGYIGQINSLAEQSPKINYSSINVLRDDVVVHGSGEYTHKLIANAPESEGNYVKVKKILE